MIPYTTIAAHSRPHPPSTMSLSSNRPPRVLHFVTGGFSGATQVAIDLCSPSAGPDSSDTLLVLRRKRSTSNLKVQALRDNGLSVVIVPGWSHLATIGSLWKLCRTHRPDILVAHGYSEHLWGRWAGWLAGVPHLVQVEHNSRERYGLIGKLQSRWLSRRTAQIVAVSEGVRESLIDIGLAPEKIITIPNGTDLSRFPEQALVPYDQRQPGVVMSARFSRQKDHLTLIRAIKILKDRGTTIPLYLAGSGRSRYLKIAQQEVDRLGLADQIHFLGHVSTLPKLLMEQSIFVLSTHYEGMPLALVEAMAAGCACIASNVIGVRGVISNGITGILVQEGDAINMANALETIHHNPAIGVKISTAGRAKATTEYSQVLMQDNYAALFNQLHSGQRRIPK